MSKAILFVGLCLVALCLGGDDKTELETVDLVTVEDSKMSPNATAATPPEPVPFTTATFIAYVALGTMACASVYIGSVKSVSTIGPGGVTTDAEGKKKQTESMSKKDAYMFPLFGSVVLFSLYCALKFFGKEMVNMLMTAYFLALGVLAIAKAFVLPILRAMLGGKAIDSAKPFEFQFQVPLINMFYTNPEPVKISFTHFDVLAALLASPLGVWYVMAKHWIATDIIGVAFSIEGIEMLSLGQFHIGAILLGGLFFYDIFWVFATDVMVSVAKSFDVPIKLVFPRDIFGDHTKQAMLGLGDIVIPGVFIALLLRFDHYHSKGKSRAYFHSTFVAYFLGLLVTVVVMQCFQAAQPALLYLVPACLGTSSILALVRGEIGPLFAYNEQKPEEAATPAAASTASASGAGVVAAADSGASSGAVKKPRTTRKE